MSDYERPEETTPPTPTPPPAPTPTPPPAPPPPPAPAATPPPSVPAPPPPEAAVEAVDVLPPSEAGPRWVGFVTTIGLALTLVVTAQVMAAIVEGVVLKKTEPQGVPGDVFHRIGYAFSNLGGTVLLFLVVAVVLVSLPVFLRQRTSDRQETTVAIAMGLAVVTAVVIGVGSILAVRYNLHLYSASKRAVPSYVRIQLVFFLLGALGTAAIALFGALTALSLRDKGDQSSGPTAAEAR